ncbi:MAG: M48 family metalloprotease, partial [Desulfofustis sp.]
MKKFIVPLILLILVGCATSPTGRSQLMLVSPEQAIVASQKAYSQTMTSLAREGKVNPDPVSAERVRTITGRIIYQAIQLYPYSESWNWSVRVIDDPEMINAWCMAGGKMAIYTGLLNKIDPTDDELAQVMAHEISHALANHTAERMS